MADMFIEITSTEDLQRRRDCIISNFLDSALWQLELGKSFEFSTWSGEVATDGVASLVFDNIRFIPSRNLRDKFFMEVVLPCEYLALKLKQLCGVTSVLLSEKECLRRTAISSTRKPSDTASLRDKQSLRDLIAESIAACGLAVTAGAFA